jgi:hypothetical protein
MRSRSLCRVPFLRHRMNESDARSALSKHMDKYRSRSYEYLATFAKLNQTDTKEFSLPDGGNCKVEIQVNWENNPHGNVRVIAKISGDLAQSNPIQEMFVMRPDGEHRNE